MFLVEPFCMLVSLLSTSTQHYVHPLTILVVHFLIESDQGGMAVHHFLQN